MRLLRPCVSQIVSAVVVLGFVAAGSARAADYVPAQQLSDFMARKGRCEYWFTFSADRQGAKAVSPSSDVACLFYATQHAGTVRERTGCFFGMYSATTDNYRAINTMNLIPFVAGRCAPSQIVSLMERAFFSTKQVIEGTIPNPTYGGWFKDVRLVYGGSSDVAEYHAVLMKSACPRLAPAYKRVMGCPNKP